MSQIKHIPFEEFAANPAAILENVRGGHTSIVVEYATGEQVQIKPYTPQRRRSRTASGSHAKTATSESARKPRGEQLPDTQNISSVGAVYDLDPGSITPG